MKYIPGYLDSFISPITGKLINNNIIPLSYNYILIGNKNNIAIESPALIDIWLEIKNINSRLSNTHFILQHESPYFFDSQALDELNNTLLANAGGVIVNASLPENNLWIGDVDNIAQPSPIIQIGNLPNLTQNYFWVGDSFNRPIETNTLPSGTLPDLTYKYIWMGDIDNRPQETGLAANYIFIGDASNSNQISTVLFEIICGTGLSGGTIVGNGTISIANTGVTPGTFAYATINVNAQGQLLSASDNSGQISSILTNLSNLANIINTLSNTVQALSTAVDAIENGIATIGGFGAILLLQAQVLGLIGAVASLSSRMDNVENDITLIKNDIFTIQSQITIINNQITDIYTQIGTIQGQIGVIQGQISDIYSQISTINGQISTIQGQITDIYNQLTAINDRIDNLSAVFIGDVQGSGLLSAPITLELMLTLDQIKKAINTVDLNYNKIINLVSEQVEPGDALNAQFLWDLMHDEVEVVWI